MQVSRLNPPSSPIFPSAALANRILWCSLASLTHLPSTSNSQDSTQSWTPSSARSKACNSNSVNSYSKLSKRYAALLRRTKMRMCHHLSLSAQLKLRTSFLRKKMPQLIPKIAKSVTSRLQARKLKNSTKWLLRLTSHLKQRAPSQSHLSKATPSSRKPSLHPLASKLITLNKPAVIKAMTAMRTTWMALSIT